MKLDDSPCHLTYCSNIHPGESWEEVRHNLGLHLPAVRAQLSPDRPFGIGLRLSAVAARTLAQPDTLAEFKHFLEKGNFYVFTLNGFPYGKFHGARVKEQVYRPDWQDPERLQYTNLLADLLAELLPLQPGLSGSISTVPGAFKADVRDTAALQRITQQLVQHTSHLVQLKAQTGKHIALALEPEPCCLLETIAETVTFFREYLFAAPAIQQLAELSGLDSIQAEQALRDHLGVCLDLCHAAVEFEDPDTCTHTLTAAGIGIFKMQITAGLQLPTLSSMALARLQQFDDGVYLHQVVESGPGGLLRYVDLPEALQTCTGDTQTEREWRVHFHVPVFHDDLGAFRSTQAFVRSVLQTHRQQPVSLHLEVETYTWEMLPPALQAGDLDQAIARELRWVRDELAQ